MRGEDMPRKGVPLLEIGSPPRAWGGPMSLYRNAVNQRITPTCVGRTRSS
ncbi:hypothetical protein LI90_380 [Carbonactinospora thermoautotrophica]|uniref:Uncharacterized protein n=1 Tax=Carbonactinospora thermoautotrophica TaxID=1469144 RepID=A0A132MMV5_9ACTN|nr:hypothetical protein LI90_380 [Carbonactinospora thermoautotrophica]